MEKTLWLLNDLFELVDVKADGDNGMHQVVGIYYHQRIRLNVSAV